MENIFIHQHLTYPEGMDVAASPIQNPAWRLWVSELLVEETLIKIHSVYEWELCEGLGSFCSLFSPAV